MRKTLIVGATLALAACGGEPYDTKTCAAYLAGTWAADGTHERLKGGDWIPYQVKARFTLGTDGSATAEAAYEHKPEGGAADAGAWSFSGKWKVTPPDTLIRDVPRQACMVQISSPDGFSAMETAIVKDAGTVTVRGLELKRE